MRLNDGKRLRSAMRGDGSMRAGWKVFGLAVLIFVIAFIAARLLVSDVVPVGYQEEAQPSWAVLTAFLLRAIELMAAWVAAIAAVVMGGAWTRQRLLSLSSHPRRPAD
jgi:hypothetical protein